MQSLSKITPCLWFDTQAEEAANYYTGIFPNSRITAMSRYGEAGHEIHGMPAGTVLTVEFELDGQGFTALNGGPVFNFNEAVSFQVNCDTQEEIDYFWDRLGAGGDEAARQCGWLKDKFGLSWQVVPSMMAELMSGPGSERVMTALLKMKKLDIAELRRAAA
jgi:predicted 3-demethylubiquinone-9 3-methyltransferase (glyoxalase superfamily)